MRNDRAHHMKRFYGLLGDLENRIGGTRKHKRRRKNDRYDDLRMLPSDTTEPVVFFGGRDYVGLFCALTECVQGQRHLFYNSSNAPETPGCVLKRYHTTTRTNWHYGCANAFIEGEVGI